jgi:glycine cleavage system regulatory protein
MTKFFPDEHMNMHNLDCVTVFEISHYDHDGSEAFRIKMCKTDGKNFYLKPIYTAKNDAQDGLQEILQVMGYL